MKSKRAITGLIVALSAAAILFSDPVLAQDPGLEKISDAGSIDWVAQKLTAVGQVAPVTRKVGSAQLRFRDFARAGTVLFLTVGAVLPPWMFSPTYVG